MCIVKTHYHLRGLFSLHILFVSNLKDAQYFFPSIYGFYLCVHILLCCRRLAPNYILICYCYLVESMICNCDITVNPLALKSHSRNSRLDLKYI